MAIMVLRTCQQVEGGLPADVTSKMYFNIILDFGIGLVPFLGDVADGECNIVAEQWQNETLALGGGSKRRSRRSLRSYKTDLF